MRIRMLIVALANGGLSQLIYVALLDVLPLRSSSVGDKNSTLAIVVSVGAVFALATGIAGGRFVDARWRRNRSPRLVVAAGIVILVPAAWVLPVAGNAAFLVASWAACQVGINLVLTMITAALFIWFPVEARGRASAAASVGQVGGVVTAGLLTLLTTTHAALASSVAGVFALTFLVPLVLPGIWSATPSTDGEGTRPATGGVDVRYRDAALAWGIRAAMTFSNVLVLTYISFFVAKDLHVSNPQRFVGAAACVSAVFVMFGVVWSGQRSDRTGTRKVYVAAAGLTMATGEIGLALLRVPALVIIACGVAGAGYGVYLAVDQALTVDVLPEPSRVFGDIGVMNASTTVPQIVAPACAALLLHLTSSYGVLFAAGAVVSCLGAALVGPIRRVK